MLDKLCLTLACFVISAALSSALLGADTTAPAPAAGEKKSAHLIDVAEAESLMAAKKVMILDVRTPQEFASGHLAGATNLNFHSPDFQAQLDRLNKQQAYLVHCAVGGRSARACKLMSDLKFTSVYDLKGGIQAWEKAGKPTLK